MAKGMIGVYVVLAAGASSAAGLQERIDALAAKAADGEELGVNYVRVIPYYPRRGEDR